MTEIAIKELGAIVALLLALSPQDRARVRELLDSDYFQSREHALDVIAIAVRDGTLRDALSRYHRAGNA